MCWGFRVTNYTVTHAQGEDHQGVAGSICLPREGRSYAVARSGTGLFQGGLISLGFRVGGDHTIGGGIDTATRHHI